MKCYARTRLTGVADECWPDRRKGYDVTDFAAGRTICPETEAGPEAARRTIEDLDVERTRLARDPIRRL
jgi:hypothetical protein